MNPAQLFQGGLLGGALPTQGNGASLPLQGQPEGGLWGALSHLSSQMHGLAGTTGAPQSPLAQMMTRFGQGPGPLNPPTSQPGSPTYGTRMTPWNLGMGQWGQPRPAPWGQYQPPYYMPRQMQPPPPSIDPTNSFAY